MTYTVKVKKIGSLFWKTYKRVKGDFIFKEGNDAARVLIFEDESRLEIPLAGHSFLFCSRRFLSIKSQMEKEAGQALPVGR